MRLYPINKGKVTIDGYDLNELSIESIRKNIKGQFINEEETFI